MTTTVTLSLARSKRDFLVTLAAAVIAAPISFGLFAQSVLVPDWQAAAGNKLSFDVASVRPDRSDRDGGANFVLGPGDVYANTGGRFSAHSLVVLDYIRFAFKLTDAETDQLQAQAPKWIATEKFDIEAKSENPNPTKDQMRLMMQSLLADRFKLTTHTESHQLPVLALELAKHGKLGPKLRAHPADDPSCSTLNSSPDVYSASTPPAGASGDYPILCGGIVNTGVPSAPSHVRLGARNVPIALLAAHLGQMGSLNRPVLNRTGLTGNYDFVIEWGADPAPGAATPTDDFGTTLQQALQEQLGLKLSATKGLVDVLVVDHIEPPSTN